MANLSNLTFPTDKFLVAFVVEQPSGWIFTLLCVLQILILYFQNEFIIPDELLYHSLQDQYTIDRISQLTEYKNSTAVLRYISTPFVLGIKVLVIALCIYTGLLVTDSQLSFRSTLAQVVNSSSVFVLGNLLITLGVFFSETEDLQALALTNDYSLHYLLNVLLGDTPAWAKHPLKAINLFELLFILLLGRCLAVVTEQRFQPALRLVLLTYGIGLLCWISFLMYLQINEI